MAGLAYGAGSTGSAVASPALAYSGAAGGGGDGGGGGKGSNTPKGTFLGGPSISAEDFNSALRSDAAASYQKGPTQTSYSGLSDTSKNAITGLSNAAGANTGILKSALDYNQGLLNSGGLTAGQRGNVDLVNSLAANSGAGNPYLDQIIKKTNDDTYADVMASLGGSGAIGSSLHMKELGGALANNESNLRYNDYNEGFNRQLAASQAGFGMGQTGTVNAMGAADRAGDMYQNMLLPYQTKIQGNALLDADAAARAAFDPNYLHLAKYQGLLGNNAASPQPAKQPGALDYIGMAGGLLGALL